VRWTEVGRPDGKVDLLNRFFESMQSGSSNALLLDYDGTLAPFCTDPNLAFPYAGVRQLLMRIQKCAKTRLLIVSGRQSREVSRLLSIEAIEIWGCHGMERLNKNGSLEQMHFNEETKLAIEQISTLLASQGLERQMERKPTGCAVHWRGLSMQEASDARQKVETAWNSLASTESLRMLRFDGGIEICAAAMNKGDVVKAVMKESHDNCSIAYLGDDITDEDAFEVLKSCGLGVLARPAYRATAASVWIHPPEGVLEFLTNWAEACEALS
jgi:trehalose-phosphatase